MRFPRASTGQSDGGVTYGHLGDNVLGPSRSCWWIGRQLIVEREAACDDHILEQSHSAMEYAEGILNVCKFYWRFLWHVCLVLPARI